MTDDGRYYILAPTMSNDQGPNCKAKVYNEVRLKYARGTSNEMLDFAQAQCVVEIPKSITLKVKKNEDESEVEEVVDSDESESLDKAPKETTT